MKQPASHEQMTLLDWTPPAPVRRFEDHRIRAASLRDQIARAIAATLRDADASGVGREEVARRMGDYLGERVSLNVLNAYASQSRKDSVISVPRIVALLHATGDRRLLELLAEPLGWAVIERRQLPLIELAAIREQTDRLTKRAKEVRRSAQRGGVL